VPKLCPIIIRNIETYLMISNSIEILEPLKLVVFHEKPFIFCT
jgi:hypothetical protein